MDGCWRILAHIFHTCPWKVWSRCYGCSPWPNHTSDGEQMCGGCWIGKDGGVSYVCSRFCHVAQSHVSTFAIGQGLISHRSRPQQWFFHRTWDYLSLCNIDKQVSLKSHGPFVPPALDRPCVLATTCVGKLLHCRGNWDQGVLRNIRIWSRTQKVEPMGQLWKNRRKGLMSICLSVSCFFGSQQSRELQYNLFSPSLQIRKVHKDPR